MRRAGCNPGRHSLIVIDRFAQERRLGDVPIDAFAGEWQREAAKAARPSGVGRRIRDITSG